jgi:uncharacterized protein YggE
MKRIAVAAALLLAAAAFAGVARPEGADAQQDAPDGAHTVTVGGTASVSAVPDKAQLSFGVETRAETAKAALAANAREARALLDALRRAGAADLRTESVVLSPVAGENGTINGFVASNTVSASIAAGRAGALIDAAVAAGANQVYGPSLSSSRAESLYRQALDAAFARARERAAVLAAAAGATLGEVTSIVEGGGGPIAFAEAAKASTDAGTPIEPGRQEISATVTVTFELR